MDRCDRIRRLVSLRLDEELSEFETRLVRVHRRACASCDTFAREITAFTVALRHECSRRFAKRPSA